MAIGDLYNPSPMGLGDGFTSRAIANYSPRIGNSSAGSGVGGLGGIGSRPGGVELGFNTDTLGLILGGLNAIGNIWGASQAQRTARQALTMQRNVANANLANQIKSYNTALEDRIRARAFTEGRPEGYADEYLAENRLQERQV